jgi:copper chaperone
MEPGGSRSSGVGHGKIILMEEITLTVTGMTCGGCENAVRRVVSSIAGVANVTASHRDNRVTVEYDGTKAGRADIERAIQNAGYIVSGR